MSKVSDFPYLPSSFDPEDELLDQLSHRAGNPRCLVGRDELLLVVHEVPRPESAEREPLVFWRRQDEAWIDHAGARGLKRLGELLERHARAIASSLEHVGKARSAKAAFDLARATGPLARASRDLATAIEQALSNDEDNRDLRFFRDRGRELERAADLLDRDARLALELWRAESDEKMQGAVEKLTKLLFRLGLIAAFCLPVTAVGAICGMNLRTVGFTVVFLVGLGLGAAAVWWLVRDEIRRR